VIALAILRLDDLFLLSFEISETALSSTGFIIFMPWVTLPESVRVGRFRFSPLRVKDIKSVVNSDMVPTIVNALKCYVRKNGEPIARRAG
jgi:hypothetical protein